MHRPADSEFPTKPVTEFLSQFNRAVVANDLPEVMKLYDRDLETLKAQNFRRVVNEPFLSFLPHDDKTIQGLKMDKRTVTVYKFIWAKHEFTNRYIKPTVANQSWNHFGEILRMLTSKNAGDLPNSLVFDVFDEFCFQLSRVYQFRLTEKKGDMWQLADVNAQLNKVISSSEIAKALAEVNTGARPAASILGTDGDEHQALAAGLFALVALVRVEVLLGHFENALRLLEPLHIPLYGKALFDGCPAAAVALNYYIGVCYLMMRRYSDATRYFFRSIKVEVRNRRFSEDLQLDAASLCQISALLGGAPFDKVPNHFNNRVVARRGMKDPVTRLRDEGHEISLGNLNAFREIFDKSAPKFIAISQSTDKTLTELKGDEGKELQKSLFLRQVAQHANNIKLRVYFKVYRTLATAKVGELVGVRETMDGTAALISLKMSSRQLVHNSTSPNLLDGTYQIVPYTDLVVDAENAQIVKSRAEDPVEWKYVKRIEAAGEQVARVLARQAQWQSSQ